MTAPAQPRRESLYATRSSAGALLGQQIAGRGFVDGILLGITPEGVEIAANAASVGVFAISRMIWIRRDVSS